MKDLDEISAEITGISRNITVISTFFDIEDVEKIKMSYPTNRSFCEALFAISRHLDHLADDIDDFKREMLQNV